MRLVLVIERYPQALHFLSPWPYPSSQAPGQRRGMCGGATIGRRRRRLVAIQASNNPISLLSEPRAPAAFYFRVLESTSVNGYITARFGLQYPHPRLGNILMRFPDLPTLTNY